MKLSQLALKAGVYVDKETIDIYGELFAHIDSYYYIVVLLGGKYVKLHRLVMYADTDEEVDHVNRNPTDTRKDNLRICTASQNMINQSIKCTNTSGYKGVSLQRRTGRWEAKIRINKLNTYLGTFNTREAAAMCYNEAALKHYGKFAYLNIIREETE